MSFSDFNSNGSNGSTAVPAWAQRATAPLVPTVDVATIKRAVNADVRELRKAADMLAKLAAGARKRPESAATVGDQLLSISAAARERARATSRMLREALGQVVEGTADHKQLTALSGDFKESLVKFQQQVEATTHLVTPIAPSAPAPPGDVETGSCACYASSGGGSGSSSGEAAGSSGDGASAAIDYAAQDQQMAQLATNEAVIADRNQGINKLSQDVQQVAEIFNDLALLVNEQGSHIDNIQTNIETAHANTTKGIRELGRAAQSQRKTRSRMCLIAVLVMVIMVLLVLALKFGTKSI